MYGIAAYPGSQAAQSMIIIFSHFLPPAAGQHCFVFSHTNCACSCRQTGVRRARTVNERLIVCANFKFIFLFAEKFEISCGFAAARRGGEIDQ